MPTNHRSRLVCLFALSFSALAIGRLTVAQVEPDKALETMQAAEGLEVTLFAAEPQLVNPTCMDIDPRGRVWVCEGVNYRGKAKPPFRKTGDRVVILEDTDTDGRADKSTVFYEGLDLEAPLGICYLGDRVLVSQSPDIVSIAIRPDGSAGEKKLFLGGFGGKNHDHGVHSMLLGPDGLLYCAFGNEGARVTDISGHKIFTDGRPYFGGCVFRCKLDGSESEVLAHNFRNNYECAVDSFGDIWQSDNDDDGNQWVRFTYVMQGGNYGYLGPTGRHWSQEKKSHFHMEDPGVVPSLLRTGAGSPTGLCVYEGSLLPEHYRGVPIHTDAGPRVVQCFRVKPMGAGWQVEGAPLDKAGHQTTETLSQIVRPETLLTSKDTFFRPSDVAVAPDGSLLISDWYDPGVGGHGMGDTSRGRIWRLTPKGHKGYRIPAFDLSSDDGLKAAFLSPALSVRSLATLKIMEKKDGAIGFLKELTGSKEPLARPRALWLLARLAAGRELVEAALKDPEPRFRILALRAVKENAPAEFLRIATPLLSDSDPQVRREILVQLRDVQGQEAVEAIVKLASQYDGQDRWYLEAIAIASRGRESLIFRALAEVWKGEVSAPARGILWVLHPPEAADYMIAKLKKDVAAMDPSWKSTLEGVSELEGNVGSQAIAKLIVETQEAEAKREAAVLIDKNLESRWERLRGTEALRAAALSLLQTPGLEAYGARLAGGGRISSARGELESLAKNVTASMDARLSAVQALGALNDRASTLALKELASGSVELGQEAVASLGRLSGSEPQVALRELLVKTQSPDLRSAIVKSLGGSKSGALLLLQLAKSGELPDTARALATTVVHSSAFEDVRLMADKVLPRPKTGAGKELPPAAELLKRKGDSTKGGKVFFDESKGNCGRCHRINKGGKDVGPDLSVIGTKYGREALLESIVSPSAAISHEYKVWVLETRSAGFVTGYIADETPENLTLRDANGQKLTFSKDDVVSRTASDVSLMPEGLVGTMTADDLVDLLEYLSQLKQPGAEAKK